MRDMTTRHASTVIGFTRDCEAPEEALRATSPEGLAQAEGWILRAVGNLARKNHSSASFRQIVGASGVAPVYLGTFLARLVDAGGLVWAPDGGYLPMGVEA